MATTISSPLKWWLLDFLSNKSRFLLFGREGNSKENGEFQEEEEEGAGGVECAVCLCTIGEGDDDIKGLRCQHVFHRVCLERWFGYGQLSCPLCRRSWVDNSRTAGAAGAGGDENFICFNFSSSFTSGDDKSSWWLR